MLFVRSPRAALVSRLLVAGALGVVLGIVTYALFVV